MKTPPYLLISDLHYHSWSAFSETAASGVNSRLQLLIDATREAFTELRVAGGKKAFIAGDVFHKRGSVEPSVLNPVMDLFRELTGEGFEIYAIPGNHDLEKNDSERLSNAITTLETCGVIVAHEPMVVTFDDDSRVALFPWYSDIKALLAAMDSVRIDILHEGDDDEYCPPMDAIIHAPIDGVLPHLPAHGLDAKTLETVGYERVFSGHYHHHKRMSEGVYSIGALTHQTWGDIGSRAGYMLVGSEEVQFETSHPRFVELTGEEDEDDAKALVKGNFVRVRAEIEKDSELKEIREGVLAWEAKGVSVIPVRKTTVTRAGAAPTTAGGVAIESSIKTYLDKKGARPEAHTLALGILSEARGL